MRHSFRRVNTLLIAAVSGLVLSGGAPAVTAQAATGADAGTQPQSVIVVLKDQLAGAPATKDDSGNRRNQATGAQDAVLGRLAGATPKSVKHFALGNAFSATVTPAQAAALTQDPAVASVAPDSKVVLPPAPAHATPNAPAAPNGKAAPGGGGPQQICPTDPAKPLLEPEALTSIHAASTDGSRSAADLATGAGVKVAFLADNMDPNYADFIRPDGSHVFSDFQDFSGDGPNTTDTGAEAFGDASSIAAQGVVVHDLSKFVNKNHPLPAGCNIIVKGVSPGASLVG